MEIINQSMIKWTGKDKRNFGGTEMDSIGNRLFELRKKKGITQEKLAEKLNVSRQSVSNWELDKSLPDTDKLLVLAQIYDVSLDYIAYGKQEEITEQPTDGQTAPIEEIDIEKQKQYKTGLLHTKRFLLIAGIVCTLLCIPVVILLSHIMGHLSGKSENLNSNLVTVERILDQYSYAEVVKLDGSGNYTKDHVWLDTRNLSEGDYIFSFTDPDTPKKLKFEYYKKTMLVPFLGLLCLVFLDTMIGISFFKLKSLNASNA